MDKVLYNLNERIALYEKWRKESKERIDTEHNDAIYDKWITDAKTEAKVGTRYQVDAGAPGIGYFIYEVTQFNEVTGDVYGKCVEDNSRELTISDVI